MRITSWFFNLSSGRQEAIAYILLVLAAFAAYANVYAGDFLLDDQSLIITNLYLRDWHHLGDIFTGLNYAGSGANKGFYRPIEQLPRLVLYQTFGLSSVVFHALSVVLHGTNAALMYRLGRKLGFTLGAAFSAALLWSVHPLFTQMVAYISSASELMWTMFGLLGLLTALPLFTTHRSSGAEQMLGAFVPCRSAAQKILGVFATRRMWLSILFYLLAVGSKETAVVFPALLTACIFMVTQERLRFSSYLKTIPFWLMSALYFVLYIHLNEYHTFKSTSPELDEYGGHIITRTLTSLATLPLYLRLILFPTGLHMERVFPVFSSILSWQVLAGVVLAAGALAQIIIGRGKRGLPLSFGFLWFAAALAPVTGILVPIDALFSEGWMYVPTIGLFLGIAQTLFDWIKGLKFERAPVIAAAAMGIVVLSLGVETYFQNEVYRTPVTFYENIFRYGGYRARAYPDLGVYYLNQRDFENSVKNFKLSIEFPDERNVPSAAMHTQLALAYLKVNSDKNYMVTPAAIREALPFTNQIPEAIDELNKALELDPDFYFANTLLSAIYSWQGEKEKAELHYQQMLATLQKIKAAK